MNRTATTTRWATRKEAAEYARTSPDSIDRWIRDGYLTRYNAGRGVRLDLNEIDAYLTSNKSGKKAS